MATDGAPIISPDGTVISGNGRTLAVKRAYNIGKAENYRQFLKNNASRFGISPELVDGMNKPVLVRELTSDIDLEEFARQSNSSLFYLAGVTVLLIAWYLLGLPLGLGVSAGL